MCCVAQIQFVAFFDGKNKIVTTANVETKYKEKNISDFKEKMKSSSFGGTMSPAFLFQFWAKMMFLNVRFFLLVVCIIF